MNPSGQRPESSLVKNISRFSHAVSAVGAFFLAPIIARNVRIEMFQYLAAEFGREIAYWGSWAFVGIIILTSFFGIAVLLQLIVQGSIRSVSRKRVF